MKIKFNKLCVCWVLFITTTYAFLVVLTGATPPDSATYSFNAINLVELIMTTRIYINGESLLDKIKDVIKPYVNEKNGEAIAEKVLDVDLRRNKNGKKK